MTAVISHLLPDAVCAFLWNDAQSPRLSASPGQPHAAAGRARRYKDDELRRAAGRNLVLFVLAQAAAIVYLGWLVVTIDWGHPWMGGAFLLAEVICAVSVFLWGEMLTRKRLHPPEGLTWRGDQPPVDVLIAVCGEPLEVVRPTFSAAALIDYPHFRVTVLDDGRSDELRNLAAAYGFAYTTRERRHFAKSGNLNHGLAVTSAPFVMTLDADQVPQPDILSRMIGFFRLPRIGFVASRQAFAVPAGDPWGNRDAVFYEAMQMGKDEANACISCGSGVIYRRKALEDIGGFPTWSVVEDLYASLLMEQRGWRGVYYAFALSEGTAPTDIFAQQQQRWQWAVDSLRILFWRNPLLTRGLDCRQRLNYFHFGWHYIMYGIAYPIFFFAPVWSLVTGQFVIAAPVWVFLCYRLPYLGFMRLMTAFLTDRAHDFKAFQMQVGLWPVYLSAIATALTHPFTRPGYTVTTKVPRRTKLLRRAAALWPNLAVMASSAAAIIHGFLHHADQPVFLAVVSFWAAWSIVALSRLTWTGLSSERLLGHVP
jgi:cellulose synthase (UDP-forming)